MNITLYTKSNCPNCIYAKTLLKEKNLAYTENNAEEEPHRTFVLSQNIRQMPAIYIEGQFVGGFAGLQAALKQVGL